MFEDICNLVNDYTSSPDLTIKTKLLTLKSLIRSLEDTYKTTALRPKMLLYNCMLFSWSAQNNTKSWQTFGCIPNLSHNWGASDRHLTKDKIQDEPSCLSVLFRSLQDIHKAGEFDLTVLGRRVHIRVWIHFFIGDTEGNNKWLGQYPGNCEGVQQPYRDCKCSFDCLHLSNPQCRYVMLEDIHKGYRCR